MKRLWKIDDIIDLEFLIIDDQQQNEGETQQAVHQKDRTLFTDHIEPTLAESEKATSDSILHSWLTLKRTKAKEQLPGQIFKEFYSITKVIFLILGIILGTSLTVLLLRYDGTTPVNIFSFLGTILIPQSLLLFLLLVSPFLSKRKRFTLSQSVLYTLTWQALSRIVWSGKQKLLRHSSGKQKSKFDGLSGKYHFAKDKYQKIIYWPLFILFQLFAVGFNISSITVILFKVLGSDVAFGWQSTIQASAESVYQLVQIISSPWAVFITAAHPTLTEVTGSHIILKDGVYHLTNPALASWWPFIVFSITFYGLIPRLVLLASGFLMQRKALRTLTFNQSHHRELLFRLTNTFLSTQAQVPPEEKLSPTTNSQHDISGRNEPLETLVLIPEDIVNLCDMERLKTLLNQYNYKPTSILNIEMDMEGDTKQIKKHLVNKNITIFVLFEGWMVPIGDTLTFLKALRAMLMPETTIHIGLTGKPQTQQFFTPVSSENIAMWKNKLINLHDPHLIITPINPDGTLI